MGVMRAALSVAVATSVGAFVVGCGGDDSGQSGGPRPTLTQPAGDGLIGIVLDGNPQDRLDPAYSELTEEIIRSDSLLSELSEGTYFTIGGLGDSREIGGWYSGIDVETGNPLLIGTLARVRFFRGVTRDSVELPEASLRRYYESFPVALRAIYPAFIERTETWRLEDVTEFEVTVDIQRERVVEVMPPYEIQVPFGETPGPTVRAPYADYLNDSNTLEEQLRYLQDMGDGSGVAEVIAENRELSEALEWPGRTSLSYSSLEFGGHHFGYARAYWGDDEVPSLSGDFPLVVDRDSETGDYRSELVYFDNEFARHINVTVDLDWKRIISVEPDEGD